MAIDTLLRPNPHNPIICVPSVHLRRRASERGWRWRVVRKQHQFGRCVPRAGRSAAKEGPDDMCGSQHEVCPNDDHSKIVSGRRDPVSQALNRDDQTLDDQAWVWTEEDGVLLVVALHKTGVVGLRAVWT
jgi:hypothetical protein